MTKQDNQPSEHRDGVCPHNGDIAVMKTEIRHIQGELKEVNKTLHGNGQPGIIEKMERRFDDIDRSMTSLQVKVGLIVTVVTAAVQYILK